MASASIMTDLVKGKEEFEVKEILNDFLEMIKEKDELKTNLLKEDEKTKAQNGTIDWGYMLWNLDW